MLPRIKYLFSFFILVLIVHIGFSQSGDSYQFIKDPSGQGPSTNEIIELKKAADSIIAKIPAAKRDSFKVIEGAIYPLLSNTLEGVNESMSILKAKATLKSKYHLLIARSYNRDGEVKIIWDLVLPKGEPYDCINDVKRQLFFGEMNSIVKKSSFSYSNIILAINSITEKFDIFLYEGFRDGECAYCTSNVESLQEVFLSQGYVGRKIKSVKINSEGTQEGNFSYNKKVKIFLQDEDTINIFSDMQSYYNDLTSVMDDIYFNFTYYNTSQPGDDCVAMNDQIEEGLAFTSDDEIAVRNSTSQYIYKCDVVVIDGEEGNRWVFAKEGSYIENVPIFPKGRIHIVLLPNTFLTINQIKNKVNHFYDKIDVHPIIMEYDFSGIPNKFGITNLRDKDAITVIGVDASEIVEFVFDRYNKMMTGGWPSSDFVDLDENLEKGDAGNVSVNGVISKNIISVIKTGTMNDSLLKLFRCNKDKLTLTAFCVFHATGHNAGIIHGEHSELPTGIGYMMSGNCILNLLRSNYLDPYNCSSKDYYKMKKDFGYTSLEEIIIENKKDTSSKMINQILRIKNRYE